MEAAVRPPEPPIIIASVGRTFSTPEGLCEGFAAGARGVRMAMGLRDRDLVADMAAVRGAVIHSGVSVEVFLDLPATRPRTGRMDPTRFLAGDRVILRDTRETDSAGCIPLPGLSPHLLSIQTGERAVFRDGRQVFRVLAHGDHLDAVCVTCTEPLESSNACSFPDSPVSFNPIGPEDRMTLEALAAAGYQPDWVLISLVNHAEQVEAVRRELGVIWPDSGIRLMPKIETAYAAGHLEALLQSADGCLVGRGDLGVALPPEEILPIQERAAAYARQTGKACTVATQILERFAGTGIPYRAELGDLALMVREGIYGVVLCQETSDSPRPAACIDLARRVMLSCHQANTGETSR